MENLDLQQQLAQAEAYAISLDQVLSDRDNEIFKLEAERAVLQQQVVDLQKQVKELARLKAQEPSIVIEVKKLNERVTGFNFIGHNDLPAGKHEFYAEPRPAVLSPDMGDVMERLSKGYFSRWVKAYENPSEPEGFVGGSVRVSDLVKLFNFALGYQSGEKDHE